MIFFYFNQRFNNLLLENEHDLNTWENILLIIGSQIECLFLNVNYLSFPLKYFSKPKINNYFFTIFIGFMEVSEGLNQIIQILINDSRI
jgi:hypothetical protein